MAGLVWTLNGSVHKFPHPSVKLSVSVVEHIHLTQAEEEPSMSTSASAKIHIWKGSEWTKFSHPILKSAYFVWHLFFTLKISSIKPNEFDSWDYEENSRKAVKCHRQMWDKTLKAQKMTASIFLVRGATSSQLCDLRLRCRAKPLNPFLSTSFDS